jgi:hypothetical protein
VTAASEAEPGCATGANQIGRQDLQGESISTEVATVEVEVMGARDGDGGE